MRLKVSKEEVLRQIEISARNALYGLNSVNMRIDPNSFAYVFQDSIAKAVAAGFEILLQNQYTDDDFERDLTLK